MSYAAPTPATDTPSLGFVEELGRVRAELAGAAAKLIVIADTLNCDSSELHTVKTEIEHAEVVLAVVGEVNRGKSTFMNALVGQQVFPSRAKVWTAALTCLRDGAGRLRVTTRRGARSDRALGDGDVGALADVVSCRNPESAEIAQADLWWPNRFARHGVVLMDTPGVNDPDPWREEITLRALHRADAAIFILDAHSPVCGTEVSFLRDNVLGAMVDRVIFVVNKADDLDAPEREKVLSRCREQLGAVVPGAKVFLVSSLNALRARLSGNVAAVEETGIVAFEVELDRVLREERIAVQFGSRSRRLRRERARLDEGLRLRVGASQVQSRDVRARVSEARTRLEGLKRDLKTYAALGDGWARSLPSEMHSFAIRVFDDAARRSLLDASSVAALRQLMEGGGHPALKRAVETRLSEVRRETLAACELELARRRDALLVEGGTMLTELERNVSTANALILPTARTSTAMVVDPSLELAETASPAVRGHWIGGASVGALAVAVAGSGGIALALLAVGVVAEVVAAGLEVAAARIRIDRLEALCARARDPIATEVANAASELGKRASTALQKAAKRRLHDAGALLDQIERTASLDAAALETEQAMLRAAERALAGIAVLA